MPLARSVARMMINPARMRISPSTSPNSGSQRVTRLILPMLSFASWAWLRWVASSKVRSYWMTVALSCPAVLRSVVLFYSLPLTMTPVFGSTQTVRVVE